MKIDKYMNNYNYPKSREYKTYTCKCGYKADVFGEKQKDFNGTFETHVCLNCRILIDCNTEDSILNGNFEAEVKFESVEPKCLSCDTNDVIKWDSDLKICPKCNGEMEQTRLELNVDQIGTIKIF